MSEVERPASQSIAVPAHDEGGLQKDGPFWLALLLSAGGLGFILLGSVTILPWISDETESKSVRSIWLALSRNLPDLGPDALVRVGFWVLIAAIGVLSAGLMVIASTVRDEAGSSAEPPA